MSDASTPDVATSLDVDTDPADNDLLGFLARIERENPEIAAGRITGDLNELLGRQAPTIQVSERHEATGRRKRRAKSSVWGWYNLMVGSTALLEPRRTSQAAQAVEVGVLAEEKLRNLDLSSATRFEVADLYTLVEHGRREYELLVVSNFRLVFHWSKGVASSIDEDWAQDAFQAGCIGLMRGLQGWDFSQGYALSTFVSWHIRQAIQRWRANEVLLIRLPVHVWEGLASPDNDLTPEVRAAATRAQNISSIDEMDPESTNWVWDGDLVRSAVSVERRQLVRALLDSLKEREAAVLRLRFGLGSNDDEPMTLDRIGDLFGVTRERIRQIEKRGLDLLRKALPDPEAWSDLI